MTYKRVWFNGTTSVVTGTDYDIAASFTIGCRFKTKGRNDYMGLINKNDAGDSKLNNYHLEIKSNGTLLGAFGYTVAKIETFGATIVTDDKWHYAVVVFDSVAQTLTLYLDGFREAAPAATGGNLPVTNNDPFRLGNMYGGYYFNGYMADAFIYNRALTEAEINYCYLHPNNPIRRGLQVSYVQDSIDIPAGTWVDRSGNARNGTLTNTVTSTYNRIDAGRNCLFFGTAAGSDSVNCGNGASLALGTTISTEFWLKTPPNRPNAFLIASKWGANNGWEASFGTKLLGFYSDTGYSIYSVIIPNFTDGAWKHVVFTHTDGAATGEVYVNGVNKTNTRAAFALTNSATNLLITNTVGGYMCATRIYDRVLTPAEVSYNYLHPNNPIRRGLVLNLSPESLYGTQWVDLSGNANHGTITGAVVKNLAAGVSGR